MLKNYLKIAWRKLKNRKGFTFINIAGLSVSIAICFLILLYVKFHLGFDEFHKDADQIYKVGVVQTRGDNTSQTGIMQGPLAAAMVNEIPEVKAATRLRSVRKTLVSVGEKAFYEEKIYSTDPAFFSVFSFQLIHGKKGSLLKKPNSIVLTKSAAEKYFPDQIALGKTVTFDREEKYIVTGIVKDPPRQSHFDFSMLIPTPEKIYGIPVNSWGRLSAFHTYFKMVEGADPGEALATLKTVLKEKLSERSLERSTYFFLPLTDIHLFSNLQYSLDPSRQSDIRYIYLFSAIAILILIIACLNYVNLSTARAADRYQEVGVRKVAGANSGTLFRQFIGESMLLSSIALILAFGLAELLHPIFNSVIAQNIPLQYAGNFGIILGFIGVILFVGFLAGCYPALYLSSFQPVRVLKGGFKETSSGALLRKSMVVTQFAIVVIMIMSSVVIFYQLNYVQQKNLGLEPEQVVSIKLGSEGVKKMGSVLKTRLLRDSNVKSVTASTTLPTQGGARIYIYPHGMDEEPLPLKINGIDADYFETLGISLIAGRNFSAPNAGDEIAEIIINEATVAAMGWSVEGAIGKELNGDKIIGVVKNFHYTSLREEIGPAMFMPLGESNPSYITAKVQTGQIAETMDWIRNEWENIAPSYPFQYLFLDEAFDELYRSAIRLGKLLTTFTILAVFIACLGLFGLVYFMTGKRAKEIGIRKVMGASVPSVVVLLGKDYLKLVLIGCIIALPAGYYVMSRWLQNFAYKIDISWPVILSTIGIALFIVLATVSWQSLKAAMSNPVDSLRSE